MTPDDLEETLYNLEYEADLPFTARALRHHIGALEERIRQLEQRLAEVAHLGTGAGVSAMRAE